jgi:hypothetical protein
MKMTTALVLCLFVTLLLCACRKYKQVYWYYYRVETNSPKVSITYQDAIGRSKVDSIQYGNGWLYGFMSDKMDPPHSIIVKNDTTIGWIKVQWMLGRDTLQMASDSGRYIIVKLYR